MTDFPHSSPHLGIRPLREDVIPAVVALNNRDRPPVRRYTVADWLRRESTRTGDEVALRLVAGDPPVAYLEVTDRATTVERIDGLCDGELIVARERRRQGIGSALLERAEPAPCAPARAAELFAWELQATSKRTYPSPACGSIRRAASHPAARSRG